MIWREKNNVKKSFKLKKNKANKFRSNTAN